MIDYLKIPLEYKQSDDVLHPLRQDVEKTQMLDNFIELIVFTPRGSFLADPDFGFEYWNHEYSNIHYRDFNNNHTNIWGLNNEVTRKECEDSIKRSMEKCGLHLKNINVSIELNSTSTDKYLLRRKVFSKYEVSVRVWCDIIDGFGVDKPYSKKVVFLVEPTLKQFAI